MRASFVLIPLVVAQMALSQAVTVITPNGSSIYGGGQNVPITWQADSVITSVSISYSRDGGQRWIVLAGNWANSGIYSWVVPYVKTGTTNALVRVMAQGINNPPSDVSDTFFTIVAALPDFYEPNDTFSTAHLLNIGDTLKGAMAMGGMLDTFVDLTRATIDDDYFKFVLSAPTLVTARTVPEYKPSDTAGARYGSSTSYELQPGVTLYDSMGRYLSSGAGSVMYNAASPGIYYCKITSGGGEWCMYGLALIASGAGSVTVLSPNGGSAYSGGQNVPITWQADNTINNVSIAYSRDGGQRWIVLAGNWANSGSYAWVVPYVKTNVTTALVRVMAIGINNPPFDVSDAFFTISAAPLDPYEPNDTFSTSHLLNIGDTLKGAIVMGGLLDTVVDLTRATIDEDYFKFVLSAPKMVTVRTVPEYKPSDTAGGTYGVSSSYIPQPWVTLYDSSGRNLSGSNESVTYNATAPGTYYCKITAGGGEWCMYGLTMIASGAGSVTVLSPNGGSAYSGGQNVPITWQADSTISRVSIAYSRDGGQRWIVLAGNWANSGSYAWVVPYVKTNVTTALVRVMAQGINNPPFDVSDTFFSIVAALPDPYEPNDTFSTAYLLNIGDTLKAAMAMGGMLDTFVDLTRATIDDDYFKFVLSAPKLLTMRTVPEYRPSDTADGVYSASIFYGWQLQPWVTLYDSAGRYLGSGNESVTYNTTSPGVYYCKITAGGGEWCMYGLTARGVSLLKTDRQNVGSYTTVVSADSLQDTTYRTNLTGTETGIGVTLNLTSMAQGSVTTSTLPTDVFVTEAGQGLQLKAISIQASGAIDTAIKSADITIPYNVDSLGGIPATSLVVLWLNDSTNRWTPVIFTLDTVRHVIIGHTTHFSIYGLFAQPSVPVTRTVGRPLAAVTSLNVKVGPFSRTVIVAYQIASEGRVVVEVINVKGVRMAVPVNGRAGAGLHLLALDARSLPSGAYYFRMRTGGMVMIKKCILAR